MLEKYQEEVLTTYKKLKVNLAHSLQNPTPANLRDEAERLYEERKTGTDILLKFSAGNGRGITNGSIGKLDIDKFRPVNHFLIDKTSNPNLRVVELVAWLIDFSPRPYEVWKKELIGETGQRKSSNPFFSYKRLVKWIKTVVRLKNKKTVVSFVLITIAAVGSYAFLEHINTQCMYWTGNQYQSVGCSVKVDHATVIALDKQKLTHLKRITRLDTIGEKDLGKVWYVKIKQDSAEFYTDSGSYPLNSKKRLMPMTTYILNKYVLHK